MTYAITELHHSVYPDEATTSALMTKLGLPIDELLSVFAGYSCSAAVTPERGYQMDVADDLERYLERELRRPGLRPTRRRHELTYSRALNQRADFGLVHEHSGQRILFEIEFRPNYEKDLIKFQIGAHSGLLAAGVMVVSIDRKSINHRYTSMPEYHSILNVLSELRPTYPLLVIGLRGQHAA